MGSQSRQKWRKAFPVLIAVAAGGLLGPDTVQAIQAFLNALVGAY